MITSFRNSQRGSRTPQAARQITDPTKISPTKPPILTQQIMTDFQISQEAWNQLSSQMNGMVETNNLLNKVIQGTYIN